MRFVSIVSGKHTILMDLCKEPLFAKLSMPFKKRVMERTADQEEQDHVQACPIDQAARD